MSTGDISLVRQFETRRHINGYMFTRSTRHPDLKPSWRNRPSVQRMCGHARVCNIFGNPKSMRLKFADGIRCHPAIASISRIVHSMIFRELIQVIYSTIINSRIMPPRHVVQLARAESDCTCSRPEQSACSKRISIFSSFYSLKRLILPCNHLIQSIHNRRLNRSNLVLNLLLGQTVSNHMFLPF